MDFLNRSLKAFWRDDRGSLTVEFMLWLPLLAFWLILSIGVYDAFMTRNQVAKAAHTISDIVTRQVTFGDADFLDIVDLQGRLLTRAREGSEIRITSIELNGGQLKVLWSKATAGLDPLIDETIPVDHIPTMAELDGVVLTEVYVPWTPFAENYGLTSHTWSFLIPSRPRFVSKLEEP